MDLTQATAAFVVEVKSSPRLRWGILGIVAILWLYGVLELRDAVQAKGDVYRTANRKAARIHAMANQTEWPSRLVEAQSLQVELENRLWRENTIGLAQASFHDWLSLQAQKSNMTKVQLTVAKQEDDGGDGKDLSGKSDGGPSAKTGQWKISARIAFDFNPQSFYPWLSQMTSNEKKVVVESLTIRSMPVPKAELLLVAYFSKPTSTADAAR